MTTGLTTKIRLVKCPRCHRLLPELPDIPVYKCGGCDAVLQAKNRKDSSRNTGLGLQNRDSAQGREVDHPSEDKEPSISSHEGIIPPHGESNLDPNNERDTNESGECSCEALVHSNLSDQQRNARNDDESHDFHSRPPGIPMQVFPEVEFSHHENDELSDGDLSKAEEASISSSSHEAIIPSSGECIIDPDVEKVQDESGDSSSEQLVRRKLGDRQKNARNNDEFHTGHDGKPEFSNQVYYEEECTYHENGKLPCRDPSEEEEDSISSPEATMPSSGECVIDPNDTKDWKESRDGSWEQLAHMKSSECLKNAGSNDEFRACHDEQPGCSNQLYSRTEFASHGDAELSGRGPAEARETSISSYEVITIPFSGESILDPNDEKDQKECEDNCSEQLVQMILSEHQKNASDNDESPAYHGEQQSGFSNQVLFADEFANHENDKFSNGDPSEDEIVDEILLSGEESSEADDRKRIHSTFESSGISNEVATSSIIMVDTQVGISPSSEILAPLAERVEEPDETISHDFEHRSSVDNFGCREVNQFAEPSDALLGMVKSPTTKSSCAYDGSVSSYDGADNQFLDHHTRLSKNIHGAAEFLLSAGEGPRTKKSLMNNKAVARDSKIPIEGKSSRLNLSYENHFGIEYRERNQNDMLQHRRHDFSMQNRSRLRREKYQSKSSLLGRDCQGGYENGSVSGSMFIESRDSRIHSSDNFVDHDQDKVRLLKMVYELQDELEKTCNLNGNAGGRVSMGSAPKDTWTPMYYNHQIPQKENWHDSEYPSYLRRSGLRTDYPRQHSLPWMTSAGKAISGPQVNYFGMEPFPENCPHSMQLLPSELWHNRGSRMAHANHDYSSCYSSCPSSPQHFLSTQLSARGSRMQSDHLSHGNHEINYSREKSHVVKHHLRPMAGAAPFVTCYYCLKLLQIPAEFLLLKRRCNRLKCGHCSKVLKFSLQSRTHIVPYTQSAVEPPSETDEHGDYALAIGKSVSNDGDDSTVLPHPSRQHMEKELGSKRSQNKFDNLKKSYQSGQPSSHAYKSGKYSTEVGKYSTMSNSPLHELMGYSSPSQVIRGLETSRRSMQK